MTIEAARLSVVVDADTSGAESGLGRVGGIVGGAGRAIGGAALAVAGFAATAGGASVAAAMSLEDAWAPVGTLVGTSSQQFSDLTAGMEKFVASSPTNADEVGMAAYMALSAGITDTADVMGALTASQQLASAGLGDIGGSMDLVTSAMNSFTNENLTADQAAQMFFGTVASGKTTTADLANGFGQIAPLAASAGVSFNDLLAATAAMTSTGMSASVAYSGIRGALTAVIAPTKDAMNAANELGINFSQAHLAAVGLPAFLDEISVATGGNVEMMASLFGGVEGLNAVLALTGPQADAFASNLGNISTAGANLSDRAAEMESTTSNRFAEMKNKVTVALGNIGEKVIGYMLPKFEQAQQWVSDHWPEISDRFRDVARWLGEAWEQYGRPVFDALVAGGKAVVQWVIEHWPEISAKVSEVMQWISDAWTNYGRPAFDQIVETGSTIVDWVVEHWPEISATIENVMTTIGEVVGAVLEIVDRVWTQYGDKIMRYVTIVWDQISGVINAAMQIIRGVVDVVMGIIHGDWSRVWEGIKGIVQGVWDGIVAIVDGAIRGLQVILETVLQAITDVVQGAWDGISGAATTAWNGIKTGISTAIDEVVGFVTGIPDRIGDTVSTMWDGIKTEFSETKAWLSLRIDEVVGFVTGLPSRIGSAASGMWDGIKNAFKSALNWVIDKWNGLEFKIPGFSIMGVGFDGFTLGVPDIPRLHTGGKVPGPPGSESLYWLEGGERVITAGQDAALAAMLATGGGSRTFNASFTVVAESGREEVTARKIMDLLGEFERSNGPQFVRAGTGVI